MKAINPRAIVSRVSKPSTVPDALTRRPFTVDEARLAGITLTALRGKAWRRIGAGLYCWAGMEVDRWAVLNAWNRRLPGAVFSGATAAWMHGLDFDPVAPIDVTVDVSSGVRSRQGLIARRAELAPADVIEVRGLRATSAHRTLLDLCGDRPDVEALVAIDMALHAGLTNVIDLWRYATEPRRGATRLRRLTRLAEPAESPMETRLRWLLLDNGLPRPQVQVEIRDDSGSFLARADLAYVSAGLIIEFDGGNHRERLISDDRRQNLLISAGFRILRFTSADIKNNPAVVVAQVRAALDTPFWRQNGPKATQEAHFWRQKGVKPLVR